MAFVAHFSPDCCLQRISRLRSCLFSGHLRPAWRTCHVGMDPTARKRIKYSFGNKNLNFLILNSHYGCTNETIDAVTHFESANWRKNRALLQGNQKFKTVVLANGQHARLILWQSEFECCWRLQFVIRKSCLKRKKETNSKWPIKKDSKAKRLHLFLFCRLQNARLRCPITKNWRYFYTNILQNSIKIHYIFPSTNHNNLLTVINSR